MNTKSIYGIIMMLGMLLIAWQCNSPTKDKKEDTSSSDQKQELTKADRKKPELVYDKNGNVTERHSISYRKTDNSIRSKDDYYYEYDDNNNVIKEVKKSHDPEGNLQYKNVNEYTYNDKNEKIEQVFYSYNADEELQRKARNTFKYDENGHKIEDVGYFDDGAIKSKIILDPDENGRLRSEEYINYNHDGIKTDHKKYYYNEYGLEKTVDLMDKK